MGLHESLRRRLSRAAWAGLSVAVPVGLAIVASSAAAPPTVKQKEAQARAVLAQVQALDLSSSRAVEAWNGAKYELGLIRVQEAHNAIALRRARHGYRIAEQRAAARLVALYESNDPTIVDAILGATSLSQIMDRIETVRATSELDRRLILDVHTERANLLRRAQALEAARQRKAQTVSELAQRRQQIEGELAKRQQLLSTIQGEVTKLKAAEAARQALLAAQARARLAAEAAAAKAAQAAAARAAQQAAAAAAAKAAAAARAKQAPAGTTTVATTTTVTTAPATPAPGTTTDSGTTTSTSPTTVVDPTTPVTAPGHPQAATIAMQYLGVPYLWGGASPTAGFDCSGLVMYVFAQLGVPLPHFAQAQYGYGVPVPRDQLQPGDLVFFDGLDHVGISLGGNEFVDAPHTGDVVKIETISGWYAQNYVGARRI